MKPTSQQARKQAVRIYGEPVVHAVESICRDMIPSPSLYPPISFDDLARTIRRAVDESNKQSKRRKDG